ncbi:MAG: S1/P1 nuclease [Rubrivivax sp.]|nr:S1/P1 nuclease [Rubrivivax sp.]
MASSSMQAYAWGAEGHRLVATIAERQLSPAAKSAVAQLLALEPGATLESISTWADEVRSPATAAWHYVNFPRGGPCQYDAAPICIEGFCVVVAIERQAAVLASNAPDDVRLRALKYVVHLVADVHQPLHGGYADDRGGNSVQLQAFGRGTNLHALWDSGLIANWPGGVSALLAAVEADRPMTDMAVAPATWAEESCRAVGTEGFYPASHKLDAEYAQRWSQTLVRQLAAAGSRLALVLNGNLGSR